MTALRCARTAPRIGVLVGLTAVGREVGCLSRQHAAMFCVGKAAQRIKAICAARRRWTGMKRSQLY